jgi:hypothetical protein
MRDTIDMAREAGFFPEEDFEHERLELFEAIVRADERALAAPVQEPVESWEDLHNALQRIDTAAVGLPTFEIRHEGGLDAVVQNIVDAIVALHEGATPPAAQPAPVQEPVAYQQRTRPNWKDETCWTPWEDCSKSEAEDCWNRPQIHDWLYEARALYTTPPAAQRPWIGLTDEERDQAWDDEILKQDGAYVDFARAIEAKLKEKNT